MSRYIDADVRVGVPIKEAVIIEKTELTDECIDKIAEAVVQKLADRKTEPIDKDINVRSKTEPSFKVDGIGDDDTTIHAIAHLQKVGWLQEHDRALTEPQTEMDKSGSRAVQTARCLNCHNAKACKEKHWEVCKYEPWKLTAVDDEPQTDCSWR